MIEITEFSPEHQTGVIELILPIQQQEFGIAIDLEAQPDLQNIAGFYRQGCGNFWLACSDGRVVGSIALLDIGDGKAALRKMFVAAPFRGSALGVARSLLATLLAWCESRAIREIYLGTTAQFLAAQHFYRKNGFTEIVRADLPASFPIMTVDSVFFMRRIGADVGQELK